MRRWLAWCGALAQAVTPAVAQIAPPSSYLTAPALPGSLPGGGALPSLPQGAQLDILQRIIDAGAGRAVGTAGLGPPLAATANSPAIAPAPVLPDDPLSPAEAYFAARAPSVPPLRQFGYDSLTPRPGNGGGGLGFGTLPDSYRIGRDDEIVLAFRGRARQTLTARIGRDGLLIVPDLPPIPAAGRTLGELRADLMARAATELGGSEVFVSLGQVRQIAIFVGGEVVRPGLVPLTAFASLLDALVAADGVRRTGSLRAIRVEGPFGSRVVDLYPVIAGAGPAPDLTLREGERILVPPLGGVVALRGEVSRPGIYELPAGVPAAPLAAMLTLAGDPLRPIGNRYLLQTADAEGRRAVREIGVRDTLRRGDSLRVEPGSDVAAGELRLAGHVVQPVLRAAAGRAQSLRGLLADPRLIRADPYPRLGVVWRTDARTRARRFITFDLARVLRGEADVALAEGDEVILLGLPDVLWLASPSVQQALRGEVPTGGPAPPATPELIAAGTVPPPAPQAGDCAALVQLAVGAQASRQRYAHARGAGFPDAGRSPCPQVFVDYPTLLPFVLDQTVLITGEVRLPGLYPVIEDTGLDQVLAAAGGVTDTADLATIEFAREPAEQTATLTLSRTLIDLRSRNFAAVRLSPRNAVRIPRGFADRDLGPVALVGEFVRPGTYDIRRGERLSELIGRAGGLTPQAYPYGAVFSRESVRQRQQEGFARSARELEQGLFQVASGQAVAGLRGGADLSGAVVAARELAASLRSTRAAGRMVVEANPVVLAGRPDLDVLLEPGDLVAIPKRPNEVTVVGAVLNPGSLQFTSGWRAAEYVRGSGGEQRFADGGRAFVVLPNGQSVPAGLGGWQAGGPPVPPGSVVVVPQDPSPYQSWGFLRDATQVLGQLALSSAALAVVVRSGGR